MRLRFRWATAFAAGLLSLAAGLPGIAAAAGTDEKQSLEEVRNTIINLLQALVDKGLLTREQAELLVKQAQDKAAADAAAVAAKNAAQAKEEEGAVRVPYVPQIVKDEISKQVAEEVKPAVVADVVSQAKQERWGIPAALPDWLSRVSVFGDVTLRGQADLFPSGNATDIFDINAINSAGGIGKATYPFLDTTEDRYRLRLRARLGVEGDITDELRAYIRLASGSLTQVAGSESQTLGTYGNRYTVGIDEAYLKWDSSPRGQYPLATLEGGRFGNPWFSPTQLVYARDLTFEGLAGTMRLGWGDGAAERSHVYATFGAFPMLEVPLQATQDKWMLGGQLGTNLRFFDGGQQLHLAGAYYDFLHVTGVKNAQNSTLTNYTAPPFVQYGNSVFDISNSTTDPTVNLFGLAAHFRIADIAGEYDIRTGRYSLALVGEAVRNLGFNLAQVETVAPSVTSARDKGYVGETSFGDPLVDAFGRWRVALGYRYVQGDAVLDAWTDADFHEGGTNAKGYYLWGMFGVAPNTWVRLRYMSGNEIDGPTYGLDILQLDLSTSF
jgi:hypothetical protein